MDMKYVKLHYVFLLTISHHCMLKKCKLVNWHMLLSGDGNSKVSQCNLRKFQKDHKGCVCFARLGSKAYQLLFPSTYFATRVKNMFKKACHKPDRGHIVKSHKNVSF